MFARLMLPALPQPRGLLAPQTPAREAVHVGGPEAWDADPIAIHLVSERGTITRTNPAFDAMFGSPRGRLVGRHQAALNSASIEANLKLLQEMRTAVASSGAWEGTLQNLRGNGSAFTTRARVHPVEFDGRRCLICFQEERRHGHPSAT